MYYIVTQTNHIIAADKALLELLSVDSIGELHQNIALNSISLETTNDVNLDISTPAGSNSYDITIHTLTSVLGDMILIKLNDFKEVNDVEEMISISEEEMQAKEIYPKESVEKPVKKTGLESFGTIDLSDAKPIHFDFQLEEAASDLSLPVELIEKFVADFIDQVHIETKNMLRAYENGDLETIQEIGHLLKGSANNLRINPFADILYKIQSCEDSSQLEDLIKEYWGHVLSFENKINIHSK